MARNGAGGGRRALGQPHHGLGQPIPLQRPRVRLLPMLAFFPRQELRRLCVPVARPPCFSPPRDAAATVESVEDEARRKRIARLRAQMESDEPSKEEMEAFDAGNRKLRG